VKISIAFVALLALVAGLVGAGGSPGSSPFLYVGETEIDKPHIGAWTATVRTLIQAHDAHADGANWVVGLWKLEPELSRLGEE
jgi:hypothetical protein